MAEDIKKFERDLRGLTAAFKTFEVLHKTNPDVTIQDFINLKGNLEKKMSEYNQQFSVPESPPTEDEALDIEILFRKHRILLKKIEAKIDEIRKLETPKEKEKKPAKKTTLQKLKDSVMSPQRRFLKLIDAEIELKLIFPTKYTKRIPKDKHEFKKLLKKGLRDTKANILKKLQEKLPDFVADLTKEIKASSEFKSTKLSDLQLQNLVFDRIELKCRKQLKISTYAFEQTINKLLVTKVKELEETIDKVTKSEVDNYITEFFKALNKYPAHHITYSSDIVVNTLAEFDVDNDSERHLVSLNEALKENWVKELNRLKQTIEECQGKPGQEVILEKALQNYIYLHSRLNEFDLYKSELQKLDKEFLPIRNLKESLELAQVKLNTRTLESYRRSIDNQSLPKRHHTAIEERFFSTLKKAMDYKNRLECEQEEELSEEWQENYENHLQYVEDLNGTEQKLIVDFYELAIGNRDINKHLQKVLKKSKDPFVKDHNNLIKQISKFSFKTRNLESTLDALNRLETTLLQLFPEQVIRDREALASLDEEVFTPSSDVKITLSEYGNIYKLSDLLPELEYLKTIGILDKSDKLTKIYKAAKKANELTEIVDTKLEKDMSFRHGDIVITIASKAKDLFKHIEDWFQKAKKYLTKGNMHIAVATFSETRGAIFSHIDYKYERPEIEGVDVLASKVLRINPIKLMDKSAFAPLKEALGIKDDEQLADRLREEFENITKAVHKSDSRYLQGKLENATKQQYRAARAAVGFKAKVKDDAKSWAKRIIRGSAATPLISYGEEGIICSGFAAKTLAISLTLLEQFIDETILTSSVKYTVPEQGAINLPFPKDIDLGRIDPGTFVKFLEKSECVEEVEVSKVAGQIFRT